MSGWAPVRARKVVAALRTERWTGDHPCPESLAETQLSCLLEVEELSEWSATKLGQHWGWSRKKATRLLVEWADWFREEGPSSQRRFPAWVTALVERHRVGTDEEPAAPSACAGGVEEDPPVRTPPAPADDRPSTGEAPRARSTLQDRSDPEPQPNTNTRLKLAGPPEGKQDSPERRVHQEWEGRYRTFRNATAKRQQADPLAPTPRQFKIIRQALATADPETGRPFQAEDLSLLVRYAFDAPQGAPHVDWWRQQRGIYLGIEDLMVPAKLPARVRAARDWEVGDVIPRREGSGRADVGDRPPRGAYPAGAPPARAAELEQGGSPSRENTDAFERKRGQLARANGGGG